MTMPYGIGFYWGHPISGAAQIFRTRREISVICDWRSCFYAKQTCFVLMFINKLEIVNCGIEPEGGVQRNLSETM